MLIDGTTATIGGLVYTWSTSSAAWLTPAPPATTDLPVYVQELELPSLQVAPYPPPPVPLVAGDVAGDKAKNGGKP